MAHPKDYILNRFMREEILQKRAEKRLEEVGYDALLSWNRYAMARLLTLLQPLPQSKSIERRELLLIHAGVCFQESAICYVLGRFIPSITMSGMSIEAALAFELLEKAKKPEGLTLGKLIGESLEFSILPPIDEDDSSNPTMMCSELLELRNNTIHLNEVKSSKLITDEMVKTAFGSEGVGMSEDTIERGPQKERARRAISLSNDILEYLWGSCFQQLEQRNR